MNQRILTEKHLWESSEYFDVQTRYAAMNMTEENEIISCFATDLTFGTGGLREVMGIGTAHINRYTIRKASAGLAEYLIQRVTNPCVVIAYDSRHHSAEYAMETALTLVSYGIKTMLFSEIAPTPQLSFAVRYLGCNAGVVITASHNPKEYNGYKVYGSDGCQATPAMAEEIGRCISHITNVTKIQPCEKSKAVESGMLSFVEQDVSEAFIKEVLFQRADLSPKMREELSVVYTPLHGTGRVSVQRVLHKLKYHPLTVTEQEEPNGDFPTVVSPNPENPAALSMGIRLAEKVGADIVLGTDPDSDRVGVAIRVDTGYRLLSGNQIGAILTDFLVLQGRATNNSVLIKTIVTNDLGAEIAKANGISVRETLTGFKFIGEQITLMEQNNSGSFFFGYEESYGFLAGTHVRDKDAVVSSMLLCEAAAFAKSKRRTLWDWINDLYQKYGYYYDALDTYDMTELGGREKMDRILTSFRMQGIRCFENVERVLDYQNGIGELPPSNVLKFVFCGGSWLAIRPSGTEPKMKIYYSIKSSDRKDGIRIQEQWQKKIYKIL